MQGDAEAILAHFALQKLHIRAGVLLGLCSADSPMNHRERIFTYASCMLRAEEEKRMTDKAKRK